MPMLFRFRLSYKRLLAYSTLFASMVEVFTSTVIGLLAAGSWLPAFTTGNSRKDNRRHVMESGKYLFRTALGFVSYRERSKGPKYYEQVPIARKKEKNMQIGDPQAGTHIITWCFYPWNCSF